MNRGNANDKQGGCEMEFTALVGGSTPFNLDDGNVSQAKADGILSAKSISRCVVSQH